MWAFLYKLASPKQFYAWAGKAMPWFSLAAFIFFLYGLVGGLYLSPPDYQQGDAFRIIYIHVPSAFLSLALYSFMAFCAILSLVWRIKMADLMIPIAATLGASFTALALVTGAIWGKPMWGTWWIWDARLTSELILFFLYMGVIALDKSVQSHKQGAKIVAIFVLAGFIDIPLIHYSVNWWNTLHQGATLSRFAKPSIAPSMLYPLLSMIAGFMCFSAATLLARARHACLYQERKTSWVKQIVEQGQDYA